MLLGIAMGICTFVLLLGLILAALWRAWFLVLILFLGIIVVFPIGLKEGRVWSRRIGLAFLTLIILIFFLDVPFKQIQKRMVHYRGKLLRGGHQTLTFDDKLAIYGSNIAMGLGGYLVGMPEAAKETLLLCIPGVEERRWTSDFAMKSKKVRDTLSNFASRLESLPSGRDEADMEETKIAWKGYFGDSRRVALALNAFRLSAKAYREGNRWRIECSGWVPVRYPERSWTHLFTVKGVQFYVEEGLFWALQQEGWLFPYRAFWSWIIYNDDWRLIR